MFTPIQIILFIFIIFAISRVYLRAREKVISVQIAFFWLIIWIGALAIVLLPQTTSNLASYFGVGRGVDVIVYIALAVLFYLIFRIFVILEDLRNEITDIVRSVALKKTPQKKKASKKL